MEVNIEIIEYVILAIILGAQFLIFYQTWLRIQIFKSIIPNLGYKIKGVCIPKEHLSWNPEDVLKNYNNSTVEEQYSIYSNDENQLSLERDGLVKLNFISLNTLNPIGLKIEKAINHYLIRNYQATTDFNLIKDIVERHVNSTEENINQSVSVPLNFTISDNLVFSIVLIKLACSRIFCLLEVKTSLRSPKFDPNSSLKRIKFRCNYSKVEAFPLLIVGKRLT